MTLLDIPSGPGAVSLFNFPSACMYSSRVIGRSSWSFLTSGIGGTVSSTSGGSSSSSASLNASGSSGLFRFAL